MLRQDELAAKESRLKMDHQVSARRPMVWPIFVLFLSVASCVPAAAGQNAPHSENAALMARLHQAIGLAQRGDTAGALASAERLVSEHPEFEPALKFKASLLEEAGRGPEAAAAYERALKLAPGDAELQFKVGLYDLLAGNREEAIRLFTRRLKTAPGDGDTLFYLAQAYHLNGNDELALKTIKECLKADPENPAVWQKYGELLCSSGDSAGGMQWLLKAQKADATLDRLEFDLAVAAYNTMDLDAAYSYANKAVEQRPNDVKALDLLAQIDTKLAKWEEGKAAFARILAVKGDDLSAQLGLGHCELELKEYAPAAAVLESVLQADPTQVLAHFYLSRAYVGLGRKEDAQHEAELHSRMLQQGSSMESAEESAAEKATMTKARELLAANQEAKALALFEGQVKGAYATPGAPHMVVGALYLYMDRPQDAERCLRKALAMDPTVLGAHTYLGVLALRQGDLEKAEDEFKAELALHPTYQLAVAETGEVLYRQGKWDAAAAELTRSRTTVPRLLYMLCDAYFHLGKVKEADLTAELLVDDNRADQDAARQVIELLRRNQQTELAQKLAGKPGS